nr:endothelin-converting enzyme 1-like [Rhipicephalus microplus]
MDDQLALEPLVARLTVFLLTELGSVDLMRLISWSVLRQLAPYADGEANGGTLNEIRDVCYDDVAEVLEPALTSKYIYKRLTPDVLREATYMGYRVRHSIMKTVGESSWLPPDARNAARRKAEAMRLIIAFPFNLTRLSALERLYADLPDVPLTNTSTGQMGGRGTGRSYVLSWLNASRFQRRIAIRYPTEIFFWLGAVNAQHTYSTNTVNLAGALLEPVIYYPGAPVAYNYGGLGQALKKRSLALNPMDSEDLADDMGVRVAFNALRNITGASDRGGTRKVAGFSELQLFFLGHCAKMCDPRVPPRERDSSKPYAPNWARCVVPLMNMPEFADAFQCASGTLMNPERKCQFW